METEIIVIGAGAAGLMAARQLARTGKSVVVLEARERIGGRIHTLREGRFSSYAEAGAEFIHGEVPLTLSVLQEAAVTYSKMAGQTWAIRQGELTKGAFLSEGWEDLIDLLNGLKEDMTMKQFFDTHLRGRPFESLRQEVTRFVEGYDAADVDKVSVFALRDEWRKSDDDKQFRPSGGYGLLTDFLFHESVRDGVTFYFSHVVKAITWREGNVEVAAGNGRKFLAKKAIITVPIGVLRSSLIEFHPDLPYGDVFESFGVGGVIKFLYEFKTPFWEQGMSPGRSMPSLGFLFSDAKIPTWWTQSPASTPLLTGWLAGPRLEKMPAGEDLEKMATGALSYFFKTDAARIESETRTHEIINWLEDPFARGAYTYATLKTRKAKEALSRPLAETLYFCGEALHQGTEMGTVEAALASAKLIAEKMTSQ